MEGHMKAAAQVLLRNAQAMIAQAAGDESQYQQWVLQLASHDVQVQVPAIWALQYAGVTVIPTLVAGLSHAHARIRRNCVDIIDHGGYGGDVRCVNGLIRLLCDPIAHIRRAAWHTLGCERCRQSTLCVYPAPALDHAALLLEYGVTDPNPALRQQLRADLHAYADDPRVMAFWQQELM